MTDTSKILLEAICGISVLCCLAYIVLLVKKAMDKKEMPFSGTILDKRGVTVIYEDNTMMMWLNFYDNGIVLEKEDGKKMCVPEKNIIKLTELAREDIFRYELEFNPEVSANDKLVIESVDDLMKNFEALLKEDKILKQI